ncbi:MAG TPA: type I pantothenate kinase, partial [Spirillospora sp.]
MTSGWDLAPSPYAELSRDEWSRLREDTPLLLSSSELDALRGLKDPIDMTEVEEVYLPLSRLIHLFVRSKGRLRDTVDDFLGGETTPTPFLIGIAGSVAVGKSTVARLLRALLSRWPERPVVELVTTDSFLLPNSVLSERGLLDRKGFPESYDRQALVRFVSAVKSGAEECT